MNVELDPLQCRDDVTEAVVSGSLRVGPFRQGVQGEEPEDAPAVVDADEHDAVVLGQG